MRKMKVFNLTTYFLFLAFLIVNGIVSKNLLSYVIAFSILVAIIDYIFEKEDYNRKTLVIHIIRNIIIILVCCYYFMSLFGLSNKIVDYIILASIGTLLIYRILNILFLRKIIEKAHIRKLMK